MTKGKEKEFKLSYNTEREIEFIDSLGTNVSRRYIDEDDLDKFTEHALLLSYRKSIGKRKKWEGIDKYQIISYVNQLIYQLEI